MLQVVLRFRKEGGKANQGLLLKFGIEEKGRKREKQRQTDIVSETDRHCVRDRQSKIGPHGNHRYTYMHTHIYILLR
jgi:hypothetical protein